MSQENPYQTSGDPRFVPPQQNFAPAGSGVPFDANLIRKVPIRPIELLQRAHSFLGDRYWLFVGITLVAVLVGSLVPFGIITGALTVGVFLCLMEHEAGRRVDLALVFKGFDYFLDSLIVVVALVALSLVIVLPVTVVMMFMMIAVMAAMQGGDAAAAGVLVMFVMMLVFFVVTVLVSMLIYLPFLFSFQLIADQKLKASDALRLGWEGSKKNFGGLVVLLLVFGLIGFVAALLCYIPLIFFLPLVFTAMFLLYRDVYRDVAPPRPATAAVPPNMS